MKTLRILIVALLIGQVSTAQENEVVLRSLKGNSTYSDFGLSFLDGETAVFASSRVGNTIVKRVWAGNKQPFLELYQAKLDEKGELTDIRLFSNNINTRYHESNAVFTKDGKTVFFSADNLEGNRLVRDAAGMVNIQLYKARINGDGEWVDIEKLPFNDDGFSTGHPALSSDESRLYFISDRPGGLGATDIYWASLNADGTFGDLQHLAAPVNTSGRELFPYVGQNDILYYASDASGGNGGLDIYAVQTDPAGFSESPKHLGSPVNSEADDFALVFNADHSTAYLSSNRKGGQGDDDMYILQGWEPPVFECTEQVIVEVQEFGSGRVLANAWVTVSNESGMELKKKTDAKGRVELPLDCRSTYLVEAGMKGYKENSLTVKTGKQNEQTVQYQLQLTLEEFIADGDRLLVDIQPIYFDLDEYEIRSDAARELKKVLLVMQKYPELKLELGSHTDSRARDAYNLVLSEKRVTSTMQWLVDKGIAPNRIKGKGFGETQLANRCSNGVKCTEAEHQMNRRTEFVIVNPEILQKNR
jgi:outer membrane protein OmpA-like peptidoglycan-associated protein